MQMQMQMQIKVQIQTERTVIAQSFSISPAGRLLTGSLLVCGVTLAYLHMPLIFMVIACLNNPLKAHNHYDVQLVTRSVNRI